MRSIDFRGRNKIIGGPNAGQPEYEPLPIWTDDTACLSVWKFSFDERLRILWHGTLQLWMLSGSTQPPVKFAVGPLRIIEEKKKK